MSHPSHTKPLPMPDDGDPAVLAGVITQDADASGQLLGAALGAPCPPNGHTNGAAPLLPPPAYCPRGCGYTVANCGCPGAARLNGRAVTVVALEPEPVAVGCRRCRGRDSCRPCGYRPANCTCPGGPRAGL